jgi:hypothetical protein
METYRVSQHRPDQGIHETCKIHKFADTSPHLLVTPSPHHLILNLAIYSLLLTRRGMKYWGSGSAFSDHENPTLNKTTPIPKKQQALNAFTFKNASKGWICIKEEFDYIYKLKFSKILPFIQWITWNPDPACLNISKFHRINSGLPCFILFLQFRLFNFPSSILICAFFLPFPHFMPMPFLSPN